MDATAKDATLAVWDTATRRRRPLGRGAPVCSDTYEHTSTLPKTANVRFLAST
jgi:hypothetical protein